MFNPCLVEVDEESSRPSQEQIGQQIQQLVVQHAMIIVSIISTGASFEGFLSSRNPIGACCPNRWPSGSRVG